MSFIYIISKCKMFANITESLKLFLAGKSNVAYKVAFIF